MNEMAEYLQAAVDEYCADLRAKVEALPLVTVEGNHPYFGTVYVADVLALIVGAGE